MSRPHSPEDPQAAPDSRLRPLVERQERELVLRAWAALARELGLSMTRKE